MKKEFNLSKHIGYVDKYSVKIGTENANAVLQVEDVKKFIKILKVVLFDDPEPCCMGVRQREAFEKIDKLVGDKLK